MVSEEDFLQIAINRVRFWQMTWTPFCSPELLPADSTMLPTNTILCIHIMEGQPSASELQELLAENNQLVEELKKERQLRKEAEEDRLKVKVGYLIALIDCENAPQASLVLS